MLAQANPDSAEARPSDGTYKGINNYTDYTKVCTRLAAMSLHRIWHGVMHVSTACPLEIETIAGCCRDFVGSTPSARRRGQAFTGRCGRTCMRVCRFASTTSRTSARTTRRQDSAATAMHASSSTTAPTIRAAGRWSGCAQMPARVKASTWLVRLMVDIQRHASAAVHCCFHAMPSAADG